jgi:hypothetical protein
LWRRNSATNTKGARAMLSTRAASAEARKRLHLLAGVLELLVVMVAWTVLVLGYQVGRSDVLPVTAILSFLEC